MSAVAVQNFPYGDFCLWGFSRKVGRKGSAKGSVASFAKTWFDGSVGVWSARTEQKPRFLIALLAFSSTESSAHNPEVVGSSPASATISQASLSQGSEASFCCKNLMVFCRKFLITLALPNLSLPSCEKFSVGIWSAPGRRNSECLNVGLISDFRNFEE